MTRAEKVWIKKAIAILKRSLKDGAKLAALVDNAPASMELKRMNYWGQTREAESHWMYGEVRIAQSPYGSIRRQLRRITEALDGKITR